MERVEDSKVKMEVADTVSSKGKKKGDVERKAPLKKEQVQLVKSLVENSDVSAEEKVRQLRDKWVEALQVTNGNAVNFAAAMQRVENLKAELESANKVKGTLERLCRELKQQNKNILAVHEKSQEEAENLRVESTKKFQVAIDEINGKIEAQSKMESSVLELQEKLVATSERIKLMEEHHAKQLEAKGIEVKLAEAKGAQQVELVSQQFRELKLRGELQDKLQKESATLQGKLQAENKSLHETIESYRTQFASIDETMKRSETLYESFRKEMDKLTKQNSQMKSENNTLVKKIIQFKEESKRNKEVITRQYAQVETLKSLCRDLKKKLDVAEGSKSESSPEQERVSESESSAENGQENEQEKGGSESIPSSEKEQESSPPSNE